MGYIVKRIIVRNRAFLLYHMSYETAKSTFPDIHHDHNTFTMTTKIESALRRSKLLECTQHPTTSNISKWTQITVIDTS